MAVSREHNRAVSAEAAALKRADEDGLTGLPNRSKLIRDIEIHMVRGPASGGGSMVAICDLDGFKRANDVFGHAAGDAVLTAFGRRLAAAFEGEAIVARIGGDVVCDLLASRAFEGGHFGRRGADLRSCNAARGMDGEGSGGCNVMRLCRGRALHGIV
ncbi:MAG: GGDEF domain-containing protein [Sphingopyxis sp.]|nr:GGDEF domain-containing protein [Sphingopyxis sp.]